MDYIPTNVFRRASRREEVSPSVNIYEVYRALFMSEKPAPQHELYCRPKSFLRVTYVTPGFRQFPMRQGA
jgi:hypothetical protein